MNLSAILDRAKYVISHLLFTAGLMCLFFSADKIKAQSNQTVASGAATSAIAFPNTGCLYKWINSKPSIGLAKTGSGDIASFTAINTGSTPIIATLTVTPQPLPPHTYGISGGYVSVLDASGTQIGTILVPTGNLKGTSPDGGLLYFGIRATNNPVLYVANSVTYQVISTIPIPAGFSEVIVNPDGKEVYVSNFSGTSGPQSISVVNTATNTVETVINLPDRGYGAPMLTADGSKLYLINYFASVVTIFYTATKTFRNVPATKPSRLLLSPDGNRAYVTNAVNTTMSVINGNTGDVVTVDLNVTPGQLLMAPDGRTIYYTSSNASNIIYALDTQSLSVSTINVTVAQIGNIYLSPDGKTIYALGLNNAGSSAIIAIDAVSHKTLAMIPIAAPFPESTGKYYVGGSMVVDIGGMYVYVSSTVHSHYDATNYSYLLVIDTKYNLVVDSIPDGKIPSQIKPNPNSPCNGVSFSFTITVNPPPPAIFPTGALSAKNTSYGTPSTSTGFSVSGTNISSGILITPPNGFEVSTDNITFSNTVTVGTDGTVPVTQVYVRLKASGSVGGHSGDIVLTSGATTATIATVLSEVTPVPLTITAGIVTKAYGAVLTAGPDSTIFTSTGLKNNETIGSVTAAYGNGSAAAATLGTYPGSVTLSAATGGTFTASNYTITYITGDIEVTAAPLTITAENKTRYFGDANPPFTVKYSGFVNNEDASQLTTLPTASTIATKLSIVGQYPITVSGASANNYNITYVPGVLTVEPQQLIVANAFTPNGDGVNDTWDIKNIAQYPNCTINIFTRYGEKVFYSSGYIAAWNGKHNGANLPVGAYYYIINLNNGAKPITGSLTIIR